MSNFVKHLESWSLIAFALEAILFYGLFHSSILKKGFKTAS